VPVSESSVREYGTAYRAVYGQDVASADVVLDIVHRFESCREHAVIVSIWFPTVEWTGEVKISVKARNHYNVWLCCIFFMEKSYPGLLG
jgi:hypothetical protein